MLACKVNFKPLALFRRLLPLSRRFSQFNTFCVCASGGQREEGNIFPLVQRGRGDCSRKFSRRHVRSLRSSHPPGNRWQHLYQTSCHC